ncbi:hypothetical protein NLI96_g12052 [Meripilus lineatus]|uniref:Uncharacterized protein n=1 Tax=Meripilus lineatus TaxID=2056292 RepID=A0AAD5UVI7_9APHY|nr:hypothetical protein NLI96_g12052 [Physisporinus lineatus]
MANNNNISSYWIDSLKGPDHYPMWRVQIQDILTDLGLLKYTDGSEQKPTTDVAAIALWETNNWKALIALQFWISESMINYVISATTSKGAWDFLAEVFNIQSPMVIVVLRQKMFHKRMEDGTDMEENIRKWREYKEKLALQGDIFNDKQYTLTILTALLPSWDPFIGSVDVSKPSAEIIGQILAEDTRRKPGSGTEDAFLATTFKLAPKKNFKKKSGKFRTGIVCHYCKKEGHFKSDYCQLKNQSNSNQNNGSSSSRSHLTQDDYAFHITDGNEIALTASDMTDLCFQGADNYIHIKNGDQLVSIGHKMGNLYLMDVTITSHAYVSQTLRDLNSQDLITSMAVRLSSSLDFDCETCTLAKQA